MKDTEKYLLKRTKELKTPVLFLVFNRPDTTKRVFEAIQNARPTKLYVAADGFRENKEGEPEKVAEVREITKYVDWNCDIKTLYRNKNLGCKEAVSSAITWFFEHEEEGIILEDDCVPDASFFSFCQDLLRTYRYDERIWLIAGYNPLGSYDTPSGESYIFSGYGCIWAWATWRRCWVANQTFDENYRQALKRKTMRWVCASEDEYAYWENVCKKVYSGEIDSWAYLWAWTRRSFHGLSIVPAKNLVSNIGFSAEATHTKKKGVLTSIPVFSMSFPIKHPVFICQDRNYDYLHGNKVYYSSNNNSLSKKILKIIQYAKREFSKN